MDAVPPSTPEPGTLDAQLTLDVDGSILAWSPGAAALLGHAPEQILGQTLDALVSAPGQPSWRGALSEAAAGRAQQGERVCRHLDGSLLHVWWALRAGPEPAGDRPALPATQLQCHLLDVTGARLQREHASVCARYQSLLELAPDAIVIVNDIGRIVLFNARARDMFGHDESAVIGSPVEVLMPPRSRRAHLAHRNGFLIEPRMRGMGAGLELAGLRRDGSEFPVEISLSPIEGDDGRFVMSAIRDITERKRIERALQDKNQELERANRAKDDFLATMSHELRTPLNAILGFTGLLLMQLPGPLNEAQRRQLELVQSSGKHLLSLINDLLDLARIDAGRTDIHLERVHCQALLDEIANTLRPGAQLKGLELLLEAPPTPVHVVADRRALLQIVLNLTGNAVKFTAQGRVTLRLSQSAEEVRMDVIDTGVGISEDDQTHLFEAFRQLGEPRPIGSEGTGLGLHLSQRLAALMQAHIEFSSRAGQGSRFSLILRAPGLG